MSLTALGLGSASSIESGNIGSNSFQIDRYGTYPFAFPVPAPKKLLAYSGRVAALDTILYVLFIASVLWFFVIIRVCEAI
jgi:hypothetical protein